VSAATSARKCLSYKGLGENKKIPEKTCIPAKVRYNRGMKNEEKKHITWKNSFLALSVLVFSDAIANVFLAVSRVFLTISDIFRSVPEIF
jgi:hypothetical protein